MNNIRIQLAFSSALFLLGCTPVVSTHSTPGGPKISAYVTKVGNDTFVSLSIKRVNDSTSWKVEFPNETPLDLSMEDIPGQTIVKWKLDSDRLNASTIKPYLLNLNFNGNTYSTTVNFRKFHQQIALDTIENVIIQNL